MKYQMTIEFQKSMLKYRIVVTYYLLVLIYYSIIEIFEYCGIMVSTSFNFKIASLLYNMVNGLYLIGFIFSIERLKKLMNLLSCGNLCHESIEVRKTTDMTLSEIFN